MSPRDPRYIHGTHADEQRRLSTLNDLLNAASLRALDLKGGERVLDVGCGLAQLSRAMARAVGPAGRVVGIEPNPEQLAEAGRQAREAGEETLVELRQGEGASPPLGEDEQGSFDVAHGRFILEHVTDPAAVVRAMVRAVRPGGRIVLEDDDHDLLRLWPDPPGVERVWRAYIRSYEAMGMDPYVGRHLVSLMHEAGARPVRNRLLFFGGCAGDPNFEALVHNFEGIIRGARETIAATGAVDETAVDRAADALVEWGRRPDAAMWYATCWAEGVKAPPWPPPATPPDRSSSGGPG